MLGQVRAQGSGSIYQRYDGKWIAQVTVAPGRYIRRTCTTKKAAGLALDKLRAENPLERAPLTTGDYLESWVNEARDIRATTRHGYQAVVTTHLVPAIGSIRLSALTPADVETMLSELAPTMAPKTLRNIHAVLRRALQQAVRTGRAERNVAAREFVDTPKVPVVEPRALTQDEVGRLLKVLAAKRTADAPAGDRIDALVIAALGTGLRMGELLGLAWEDIGKDHLTVRQALVDHHREDPKTERSKRRVPLSVPVIEALERQRARQIAEGFIPVKTGPVMTNHRGKPLSGDWATHHFYLLLDEAKIKRLPFKNLRTTYSTRLFEAGVSDRTIADLMGHTRTATTQKHYIASAGASQDAAVAAIERSLAG